MTGPIPWTCCRDGSWSSGAVSARSAAWRSSRADVACPPAVDRPSVTPGRTLRGPLHDLRQPWERLAPRPTSRGDTSGVLQRPGARQAAARTPGADVRPLLPAVQRPFSMASPSAEHRRAGQAVGSPLEADDLAPSGGADLTETALLPSVSPAPREAGRQAADRPWGQQTRSLAGQIPVQGLLL